MKTPSSELTIPTDSTGPFWKRFWPLFLIGMPGIVALAPVVASTLSRQAAQIGQPAPVPIPVLVVLSLVQTAIVLAASVALGTALAPKLGLCSHLSEALAQRKPLGPLIRPHLKLSALLGVTAFLVLAVLDMGLFRPLMGASWQRLSQSGFSGTFSGVLAALLYGGITEELLLRWGVMSLIAWLLWRAVQKGQGVPSPTILWAAIFISTLLFGAGHLPATALLVPLTPVVILRALVLNGIFGVVAGWLFWKRGLEAAMVAHMAFHLASTLASLLVR